MNFSENTARDIEDRLEEITQNKVEKNKGIIMTTENKIEVDGRQLGVSEEENTWRIFKNTLKQYSPEMM